MTVSRFQSFPLPVLLLLLIAGPSGAATLLVSQSGNDSNGLSWESAFNTIGKALMASETGDRIWIASGTYEETIKVKSDVSISGGFLGDESLDEIGTRDSRGNLTIISGKNVSTPIVTCSNVSGVRLETLTIKRASENSGVGLNVIHSDLEMVACIVEENRSDFAGGMRCQNSSVVIRDSTFTNNSVPDREFFVGGTPTSGFSFRYELAEGGGINAAVGELSLIDCLFVGNNAGKGAGLFLQEMTVTIEGCTFMENRGGYGAGIGAVDSDLTIKGSRFLSNVAEQRLSSFHSCGFGPCNPSKGYFSALGSALALFEGSVADLSACWIQENDSADQGSLYLEGSSSDLRDCLLILNQSCQGGALFLDPMSTGDLSHCTVYVNVASASGGGVYASDGASLVMVNSIFWEDFPDEIRSGSSEIRYSCIRGGGQGEGNIDEDPGFVDSGDADLRLLIDSPCIDSGTGNGHLVDLDGNPRPVDVLGKGHEGPNAFDMGTYEFQLPGSDFNSNGYVDPMDLFIFQLQWMKTTDVGK
ncbi:MAG: right-handed parallel beta-helix repeat-containing protein [Candidatus Omnitrophica bacterium]|nr:right-handed parallel beta-helix repeat-containing protein [Candidatus Omnitrophota bacterium]